MVELHSVVKNWVHNWVVRLVDIMNLNKKIRRSYTRMYDIRNRQLTPGGHFISDLEKESQNELQQNKFRNWSGARQIDYVIKLSIYT